MKKTIFNIFIFAAGTAFFASCTEKRYDCYCTNTVNQEFLLDAVAKTKKRAADICKSQEISGQFNYTTTCELR